MSVPEASPFAAYDGRVDVGGPAHRRVLGEAVILKAAVGPMKNNAYFVACRETGAALLIDAAAEPGLLVSLASGFAALTVVTTHSHPDHWQGLAGVQDATGAASWAHGLDAGGLPGRVDRRLQHGEQIAVGGLSLEVIHLRGHTPGSIALRYDDPETGPHLFTGDSLFPGGVGNTWGDPAAFASLYGDVASRLFAVMPDETWVYPGHGHDTTLGAERPNLQSWAARGW
jgi:glyoxylase-like metal-dependent hydrolase (beta-lactamase superfamily II)